LRISGVRWRVLANDCFYGVLLGWDQEELGRRLMRVLAVGFYFTFGKKAY
jgi:hypothetical protein